MPELLEQYTITDILIFLFLFATGLKAILMLWDWFVDRLRKFFNKEVKVQQDKDELKEQVQQSISRIDAVAQKQDELVTQLKSLQETVTLLVHSDKDDIKSWITEKHHYFCYESKCIDYQSLDCIEKRYRHYVDEGGNSYVADLMNEIRALPKVSMLKEIEMENKKK